MTWNNGLITGRTERPRGITWSEAIRAINGPRDTADGLRGGGLVAGARRRSESPSLGVPDDIGCAGKRLPKEGDEAMPAPDTKVTEPAAPSVPADPAPRSRRRRVGIGTRLLRFAGATWRP